MVYVSPACEEMTGYAAADFVRDPVAERFQVLCFLEKGSSSVVKFSEPGKGYPCAAAFQAGLHFFQILADESYVKHCQILCIFGDKVLSWSTL